MCKIGRKLKPDVRLIQLWHAPRWPRPLLLHVCARVDVDDDVRLGFYFADLIFVDRQSTAKISGHTVVIVSEAIRRSLRHHEL